MKLVSFVVMAAVVLSTFNFAGSLTVVHAAGTAPALSTVNPVAISNGNKTVTLTFDQPIALSADAPNVPVLIKRSGMGSFVKSDFLGLSVTGDAPTTKLQISFDTPLTGTDNQIRVQAGTVVNADASQANAVITIGNITLGDVTPPTYLSQVISSDGNKVTLTFDEPIFNNPGQPLDAQLYYNDAPIVLAAENPIVVNGNTIVITLAATFSEGSYDLYLSNVQDQSGNLSVNDNKGLYVPIYNYPHAPILSLDEPITFAGSEYHVIGLQFDQQIANNLASDAALKTAITISTDDGSHYSPLGVNDRVYVDNKKNEPSYLIIYVLPGKQRLGTYKVKVASGALKSLSGVAMASDNITPSFTLDDATLPMLVDATAVNTSDNGIIVTTVTLNFSKVIRDDTGGSLKDWIMLNRSTSNPSYDSLGALDTAELDTTGLKLIITLYNPLKGNQNQIFILGGAFKYDDIFLPGMITNPLSVAPTADTAPPQLKSYAIDNQNHDITFVFDENIINATTDATTLKEAVNLVSGYNIEPDNAHPFAALGTNDTVTISGNKLVIHLASALTELSNYVRIAGSTLKDASGNVVANDIITEEIQPKDFLAPKLINATSDNKLIASKYVYALEMEFDKNLIDNTIDAHGISHLKEKFSYSIDQGNTYLPLGPDDSVVAAGGNIIGVSIHTPLSGWVFFKLDAGAIKDDNGNVLNSSVTLRQLAPVIILSTNLYSNVPSELNFLDNPDWTNKIQKIEVAQVINTPEKEYPILTTLTEADYTITSGKISVKKGIFKNNNDYRITIFSLGYEEQYFESRAIVSTEAYYIAPIVVERTNGITAKVSILNTGTDEKSATVIFQLKKGDTAVSYVPMSLSNFNSGTYTVNFNVLDPGNPDYKVYAYVVSDYSNDPANVGINLSTEKSQLEFELWFLTRY
ncbi:hemoblobin-interacting domain-containing protein [Cohnella abietis]|nr:hypothetical protein [Cohnella abietis]